MTRRDLAWRSFGGLVTGMSCAIGAAMDCGPLAVLLLPLAFLGLPMMIHGKRVGQMVRTERRGRHPMTDMVHAARLRRRD